MRRLAHFLRSIIPADPAQLVFLAGVVCLVISPRLKWWPRGFRFRSDLPETGFNFIVGQLGVLLLWPIIFAGIAGYFVCFWPGRHPTRRILRMVFVPALAGMGLLMCRIVYLTAPSPSILETTNSFLAREIIWARSIPWKLLPGLHLCLLGLLLVGIFLSRMAFGISSLPLTLPQNSVPELEHFASWRRLEWLIWFLVGPLFLSTGVAVFLGVLLRSVTGGSVSNYVQSPWFARLASILDVGLSLGIALLIMGRHGGEIVRKSIRWPGEKYILLAVSFPIASAVLLSVGQYTFDRFQWALQDFGVVTQPDFRSYFSTPDKWLLLLFFSAFFEEIIFRGLLQPRFIQRYGLYRGIFLVGVVWAAFHFVSDFSFSGANDWDDVPAKLSFRLFMCVTLSFVLGWLALDSRSIFPPAIAHTFYNIFVYSNFGSPFEGRETIRVILWASLAFLLFRYWPPAVRGISDSHPEFAESLVDSA